MTSLKIKELSGIKRLDLKSDYQAFEITGSEETIKEAIRIIQEVLNGNLECIGEKSVKINVPTTVVRNFIGLKGRNIKQLQIKTETYIEVQDELLAGMSSVIIKGDKDKVMKASTMVKGLIEHSTFTSNDVNDA